LGGHCQLVFSVRTLFQKYAALPYVQSLQAKPHAHDRGQTSASLLERQVPDIRLRDANRKFGDRVFRGSLRVATAGGRDTPNAPEEAYGGRTVAEILVTNAPGSVAAFEVDGIRALVR
jgi:hypothetical protein